MRFPCATRHVVTDTAGLLVGAVVHPADIQDRDGAGLVQGWINYYGHFYRSRLLRDLQRIGAYLVRWSRYKYTRLRAQTSGARD